jgi:phenylalanyl-tRNA synthetase beta chain
MTNSLTRPEYSTSIASINEAENVEILNKLSEDLGVLRQSLVFTGLEVVAYNINRRQKDLKLFEFGKEYRMSEGKYNEEMHLALWLTGMNEAESWTNESLKVEYQDIAGPVSQVLEKLNITQVETSNSVNPIFQYGLSLQKNGKVIAECGMLKSSLTKPHGVKQEIFYADFNWDLLLRYTNDNIIVERVSRFPEVRRDLSLVIEKTVQYKDILALAQKTERKFIKEVNVFDLYEGPNLGKDKKAYSVKFILEDKEKTLTDKVIDKTMNKLMKAYENELGAIIRK